VIDRVSNNTVGAGMILDREPNVLVADLDKARSTPKSQHVTAVHSKISREERVVRLGCNPKTIWMTGLVCAGKTTTAYALERSLFDAGRNTFVIDGGNARLGFSRDLGFSADDRRENIRRAAEFARMLNEAGMIAICSFLSPAREDRNLAREIIGEDRFVEVYLSTPLDVCRTRDEAGIYHLAETGRIEYLSGVSAPYDVPQTPHLIIPAHEISVQESVKRIMECLQVER